MPDQAITDAGAAAQEAGLISSPATLDDRLAAAQSAEERGDLPEALRLWAALRADFPDHPAAYHRAGLAMLRLMDEANTLLEDARARFPGDIGIAVTLARVADRHGDHPRSITRWTYVKQHFPTYAVGYFNLGLSLRRAGRLDEADPAMRTTAELFPDYAEAAIEYARLADVRHDWPEAAKRWAQVRDRFPDHPAGYLEAASSARSAGDPDAEDRMLDLVLVRFPENFDIITEFLRHASGSGDWPRVLRRWDKVRALFPDRPVCYTSAGHALRMLQRLDDADVVLTEGVRRCPADAALASAHAWMAYFRRDWLEAVRRWVAIRGRDSGLLDGFIGLAAALSELQRYDEAELLLDDALRRFPDDPHPLIDRVWLALKRSDWPEAVRRGADARAVVPGHPVGYTAPAIALREMERFDEADAVLEEGIQRLPDWRPFVDEYAEIAQRRGDLPRLLVRLKAGLDRFPGDGDLQRRAAETEARVEAEREVAEWAASEESRQRRYLLHCSDRVGIGHTCMAILQCAYYAHRTGRVLALDMRQSLYFANHPHEEFFANFGLECPAEFEVITDLAEIERISARPDIVDIPPSNPLDPLKLIKNEVLRVRAVSPGANNTTIGVTRSDTRFRVVPRGAVRDAWESVMAAPQWTGPVIGLHFRALLGEVTPIINPVIVPDFDARCEALMETYVRTARIVARDAGYQNPAFLITSEDRKFVQYVKERLPNSFSIANRLPDVPGQSFVEYLQEHGHDLSILIDAVNDAWCLSECDHIICTDHSRFTKFTALNSRKLDSSRIHTVAVPQFGEVLQTLEPAVAAEWARNALIKLNAMRSRDRYFQDVAAVAFDRAGATGEAAAARRHALWYQEALSATPVLPPSGDEPIDMTRARYRAALFPGNPYMLAGYGDGLVDVLAHHGRIDEAVAAARRAVEMDPDDPYLLVPLGRVLTQAGLLMDAEAALRRSVEIAPGDTRLRVEWSECLVRLRFWDQAIDAMRAAVAQDPRSAPWRARLAELLLNAGRTDEAEMVLRDAITLYADNPRLYHLLSVALDRQNRTAEAIKVARRLQELEPANAGWPQYIGGLMQRLGQTDPAAQAYR